MGTWKRQTKWQGASKEKAEAKHGTSAIHFSYISDREPRQASVWLLLPCSAMKYPNKGARQSVPRQTNNYKLKPQVLRWRQITGITNQKGNLIFLPWSSHRRMPRRTPCSTSKLRSAIANVVTQLFFRDYMTDNTRDNTRAFGRQYSSQIFKRIIQSPISAWTVALRTPHFTRQATPEWVSGGQPHNPGRAGFLRRAGIRLAPPGVQSRLALQIVPRLV